MKHKPKAFSRLMAALLAVVMVMGMLPVGSMAAEISSFHDTVTETVPEETNISTEPQATESEETETPTATPATEPEATELPTESLATEPEITEAPAEPQVTEPETTEDLTEPQVTEPEETAAPTESQETEPEETVVPGELECTLQSGKKLNITEAEVPIEGWEAVAKHLPAGYSIRTDVSFTVDLNEFEGNERIVVQLPEAMIVSGKVYKLMVDQLTTENTAESLNFTVSEDEAGNINQVAIDVGSLTAESNQIVISAISCEYAALYGDSHGGQTGDGSIGGGTVGKGKLSYSAPGVTLQVVYHHYRDVYDKETSYNTIVKDPDGPVVGKWAMNSKGVGVPTIFYGDRVSSYTVFADRDNGVAYELDTANLGSFKTKWGRADEQNTRVPGDLQPFFQRVIFGNSYGSWDKKDIGASGSLYTRLLRYLGTPDHLIQNYLDAYNDRLSPYNADDADKLIPTIIWSYVVVENRGGSGSLLTPADIYNPMPGQYNNFSEYWNTTFTDTNSGSFQYTGYIAGKNGPVKQFPSSGTVHAATADYLRHSGCANYADSYCCCSMFGNHWHTSGNAAPHKGGKSNYPYIGTGLVNRIQADSVDQADGQGNFYFFRNYWTPLGEKIQPQTASVSLQKSINASQACIEQLKDNGMYSLAGAQYTISINGVVQETLTTDAAGYAASNQQYTIGTELEIREITAPPGFKLDTNTHFHRVQNGTNIIQVEDVPVFDPPFALTKVDKYTTTPQGDTSFTGAIFKWEYFDNTSWSGTAKRTWYFQTDAKGKSRYSPDYLAPGYDSDPLYVNSSGKHQIPLGTVTITEIVNPLGYVVVPQPLQCTIVFDESMGARHIWTPDSLKVMGDLLNGNWGVYEPIDTDLFGSLSVDKIDAITGTTPQGDATLAGAKFEVINNSTNSVKIGDFAEAAPGEVCYEFVTDASGHFVSDKIFPLGSYIVREKTPPDGFTLNTAWEKSFTVTKDQSDFAFTVDNSNACPNSPILGGIKIIKQDEDLGSSTGADAPLDGISFSVINMSKNPVVVGGTTYQKGDIVLSLTINWDGSQWSAATAADMLPYGTYLVKENESKPGMANDYYELNPTEHTVEIRNGEAIVEVVHTDKLHPGKIEIEKVDPLGRHLAGAKFCLEWSEDGSNWQPVVATTTLTKGGCTTPGLVDGCLTTAQDGVIAFEGLYPTLHYKLTEVEAPDGYVLLEGAAFEGKLPVDDLILTITVHNSPGFTFPTTGSNSLRLLPVFGMLLIGGASIVTVSMLSSIRRRRRK